MTANGCRTPTITKKWRDDARLLLDRDRIALQDALAVLRWSQANEFWKANILSIPKLRAKFDTIRLQMERDGAPLPATEAGLNDWLRKCWESHDTKAIEDRSGLVFQAPDIPAD
ncbi:hypothetical protein, partial [Rhodococcus jostii]|uniref:hypothetical protein n=1 Tax=Rhodococcus jostii TaxID=132919 RepID=UPI00364120CD